jgi:hypothetical protein
MDPFVHTIDEFLEWGLAFVGLPRNKQQNMGRVALLEKFRAHYGVNPNVCGELFVDLQTTDVDDARIDPDDISVKYFLMSIHFLKCYPTESQLACMFGPTEKTCRTWIKFYVERIQSLKVEKVSCRDLRIIKYTVKSSNPLILLDYFSRTFWRSTWMGGLYHVSGRNALSDI